MMLALTTSSLRRLHTTAPLRRAFLRLVEEARARVPEVTPQAAQQLAESDPRTVLVDTREQSEWHAKRIQHPRVVHLSKGVIERDVEKVVRDTTTPIVTYCAGGLRSLLAAESLQRMGFSNVRSMAGGIDLWERAGLPVDATPLAPKK